MKSEITRSAAPTSHTHPGDQAQDPLISLLTWDTSHSVPVLTGHHQRQVKWCPSPKGTTLPTWSSPFPNSILLPLTLTDTLSPILGGADRSRARGRYQVGSGLCVEVRWPTWKGFFGLPLSIYACHSPWGLGLGQWKLSSVIFQSRHEVCQESTISNGGKVGQYRWVDVHCTRVLCSPRLHTPQGCFLARRGALLLMYESPHIGLMSVLYVRGCFCFQRLHST